MSQPTDVLSDLARLGTAFALLAGVDVVVDRSAQLAAIDCHQSQSRDNPVLVRCLQLQGLVERIRLPRARPAPPTEPPIRATIGS